jgi:hypothetical protein
MRIAESHQTAMSFSAARRSLLIGFFCLTTVLTARAEHIKIPVYQGMETKGSRVVTTNPLSGMILYRIEYKDQLAVAYRICHDEKETFPFAIADFAHDILYLDNDRDGHVEQMIASAHLASRNLVEDLPRCPQASP